MSDISEEHEEIYRQEQFNKAMEEFFQERRDHSRIKFHTKLVGQTMRPNAEFIKEVILLLDSSDAGDGSGIQIGLDLVREPWNKYDSNAIAVYVDDLQLGYLPRETVKNLSEEMGEENVKYYGKVSNITGQDKANQGVNIAVYEW